MAAPVIVPELQFVDANGHPIAAGTLETYVRDTTTPKATWVDPDQVALNENPITLDSSGRCLCWGDGLYRLVLRDAAGNLIWDQPATTIVSAAMAPVVAAPTIADARNLLGISDAIAAAVGAETARAEAAEASLQSQINTNTSNIASLRTDLNAEIARAEAAETHLQSEIDALGTTTSGWGGYSQIYTAHQQVTTLTVDVPAGRDVKLTCNPVTGSTDVSGTTWLASGTLTRDGTLLGNYGYTVPTDPQPSTPPPFFPAGPIDNPGSGSHTYTVSYFVHPDVTAATGISGWAGIFSGDAACYMLAEFV